LDIESRESREHDIAATHVFHGSGGDDPLGLQPFDLAGWAIAGKLDIVTAIEPIEQDGEVLAGLVVVPVADILNMFRRWENGQSSRSVRRIRLPGQDGWTMIADPLPHIEVELADLMVLADEVYQFELLNGMANRWTDPGGAPSRYDWEGLYVALIRRVHFHGLPATQAEWIADAQAWFAEKSRNGEVPDESTIRRRLGPIWKSLQEDA